ncbi:hypothetical protein EMPG_10713 [Blastomyces silverae]|uniref:Uncharacterized protein n=1 Tax=Blastomyces silverae TaxID=2060906 RepID=A0A0H1B367_9EURO|nr:hypothetical protein EMPG_10713 [Blastomyces silverae]
MSRFSTSTSHVLATASPDETALSQDQRKQLFSGQFPTDFSGEVITMRTTRAEYHKLWDAFSQTPARMKRSVSLDFNEQLSTTAVRQRETPIHQSVIGQISYQVRNLLARDAAQFYLWGDTKIAMKLPDPDLQMLWQTDSGRLRIFAVEVAFSQKSEDAEARVKALLRDTTIRAALMIDVKEEPSYNNPLLVEDNIELYRENMKRYKSKQRTQLDEFETLADRYAQGRPPFSPIFVHGLLWTGELTAAVQVFAKDPTTGEPVQKTDRITFFGNPKPQGKVRKSEEAWEPKPRYEEYPSLNLKMSDFVPLSDDIYKRELTLDWDELRRDLTGARLQLAWERYLLALRGLEKNAQH